LGVEGSRISRVGRLAAAAGDGSEGSEAVAMVGDAALGGAASMGSCRL
jgi:hypothetical protein